MSVHTEDGRKRSANVEEIASAFSWRQNCEREKTFMSFYARKEDFSGLLTTQIPQPDGEICFFCKQSKDTEAE